MTDREAMKLALEALERSMEAGVTGIKVDQAITALRKALAQQKLSDSIRPKGKSITKVWVDEINQALAQPEPSINLIPSEWAGLEKSDIPIDRGAWSDVPDATKWVDELRGGDENLEEPPNSTTDVVEPEAWVLLDLWKTGQHWPDDCFNSEGGEGMTPLYTVPIKRKGWQYAKECEAEVQRLKEIIDELENDDPQPKRKWVGLTDEEKWSIFTSKDWTGKPLSLIDAILTAYEEKNRE